MSFKIEINDRRQLKARRDIVDSWRKLCSAKFFLKKMKVSRFGHGYFASQFSTWDHDFGHVTELCCKANKWDSFLQYFAQPLSTATTNFYFFFVLLLLQFFNVFASLSFPVYVHAFLYSFPSSQITFPRVKLTNGSIHSPSSTVSSITIIIMWD